MPVGFPYHAAGRDRDAAQRLALGLHGNGAQFELSRHITALYVLGGVSQKGDRDHIVLPLLGAEFKLAKAVGHDACHGFLLAHAVERNCGRRQRLLVLVDNDARGLCAQAQGLQQGKRKDKVLHYEFHPRL